MSPLTKKIVIFILGFFGLGVLVVFMFFSYQTFFTKEQNNFDWTSLFDGSKEKAEKENKDKEDDNNDNEKDVYNVEHKGCEYNGQKVLDRTKGKFYIKPSVGIYQDCEKISVVKICDNGVWEGNHRYTFSSCEKTVDCKINNDFVIKDETEIFMYDRQKVFYGDDCEKYKAKRFCSKSLLLGPEKYKYKECKVDYKGTCKISEMTLANGKARVFFSTDKAPYGTECKDFMKWRKCLDGSMQGDSEYHFLKCEVQKPKNCTTSSGAVVEHNTSAILYSSPTTFNNFKCDFLRKKRHCDNGVLDGDNQYIYSECVDK